jgi:hypothetical protein
MNSIWSHNEQVAHTGPNTDPYEEDTISESRPDPDSSALGRYSSRVAAFFAAVSREVLEARGEFSQFHSFHEAYSVLREEVLELEQLVYMPSMQRHALQQQGAALTDAMLKECVQIAAMSLCYVLECLPGYDAQDIAAYRIPKDPPASYAPAHGIVGNPEY